MSMSGTGEYRALPDAMRAGAGNVGGIIVRGVNAVADLERLILAPSSFAAFGSTVAAQHGVLQSRQVTALRSLLSLLQQVNELVNRGADACQAAAEPVTGAAPATIWGSPGAAELAGAALTDSVGAAGEPGSAGNVLRYLEETGLGDLKTQPVAESRFHDVASFSDWLGADADNQARIGVVAVHSGTARNFRDVPGGVRPGDVVIVEPRYGREPFVGVAAGDGQLYNHGVLDAEFDGPARVSVYRPAFS
jgi:hypothetical protein